MSSSSSSSTTTPPADQSTSSYPLDPLNQLTSEKQRLAARRENNGDSDTHTTTDPRSSAPNNADSQQQQQQQQQSTTAPDSIHEDLFYGENGGESAAIYSKEATLSSNREEDLFVKASWRLKLLILFCMLALPVGCHYLEATVGTLKTALKDNMHINNTQFGILVSAVTLVNTVLPLFAGIFIDDLSSLGSIRGTTLVSIVIFIGSMLVSIGSGRNSFPIMVAGQVVYGLGGGMIVTMQEGILSRWFRDRELAIVIGILLCVARLTKWAAKMVCYPIVYSSGSHSWPIHVATIFCAAGVLMNVLYWMVMWHNGWATLTGREIAQPKHKYRNHFNNSNTVTPVPSRRLSVISQAAATMNTNTRRRKPSGFQFSYKLFLYVPGTFWMIPWIQLIMSSVLSSFDDIATEFVQFRFQTTSIMAGYQSSLTQVVPIVVAPIMGIAVHRYGQRVTSLLFATLVLILSMVLLAHTWIVPAAGMIIFSIALALGPVSVLSSTSMLLPHELAGTGMGLHKCANNIGTTIVAVIVGYVQDLTYHDGDSADDHRDLQNEYNGVMTMYLVMACSSTLVVGVFWLMDHKILKGWLQADKTERDRRLDVAKHEQDEEDRAVRYPYYGVAPEEQEKRRNMALQMIGSRMRSKKTYVYVTIYTFWFVAAWVIFFTFALMPVYQNYTIH
ncbi:major facilitator superfamily domain-containing protein [Zychaea mexicana]|uniref:major facilitator superfamily domain-containing protein n=1 Tax=Zychaea mexicana TaxID=64656 RepID=UPI0022FEFFD8|nr:major facilitator superfamily domain-containing protein [Zychaea mexicana]KAI9490588.1 major facilitator superfamily domain-containing protein [Zychaea mexicana]